MGLDARILDPRNPTGSLEPGSQGMRGGLDCLLGSVEGSRIEIAAHRMGD